MQTLDNARLELTGTPTVGVGEASKNRSAARIMIIDDEPLNIRVARKYLELAGYSDFVTTSDATQAERLAQREELLPQRHLHVVELGAQASHAVLGVLEVLGEHREVRPHLVHLQGQVGLVGLHAGDRALELGDLGLDLVGLLVQVQHVPLGGHAAEQAERKKHGKESS